MTSREDLARLFRAAYRHLEPGGVMIVSPDGTKETFEQNETHVSRGNAAAEAEGEPKNVDVVFIENNYDPDPTDDTYEGLIVYLIREQGKLRVEVDHHVLGIFAADVWPALLREVGYTLYEDYWRPGSVKTHIAVKAAA